MKRPPTNLPPMGPMNSLSNDELEELLRQSARALPYPPTPNVADRVIARLENERISPQLRLQPLWVAALILAVLMGLWAVPPVRAAILDFLQIGAVRIWLVEPTSTPVATEQTQSLSAPTPNATFRPTPLPSLLDLAGRTTLAEAERQAGFSIRLPTYPTDVGAPDEVFYQLLGGPTVVLVWTNPERPSEVKYSLHIFGNGAFVQKMSPPIVMTTTVNGNEAAWMNGPYVLAYGDGNPSNWQTRYLVSGQVLVWQEDGLTYRLESELPMDEAIRMAESLD